MGEVLKIDEHPKNRHTPRIEFSEHPTEIRSLHVSAAVFDEENKEDRFKLIVDLEAHYDLDPKSPNSFVNLPVTSEVARALVEQCARIYEGDNDTKFRVKRTFGPSIYVFHCIQFGDDVSRLVEFNAEVKGSPQVSITSDSIWMRWKVSAMVGAGSLGQLAKMVGREDVKLTVSQLQQQLPIE